MPKKNYKRIVIDIPPDWKLRLKAGSEKQNITMSKWIRALIYEGLIKFEKLYK